MLFRGETACIQCGISTWESWLQSLPDPLCSASGKPSLLTWHRRHSVSVCPLKPGCFCLNTSSDGELIVCPVLMLLVESESVRRSVCPIMDCSHQAPMSVEFSRQEYWNELPFPSPGDLPNPGIEARSPALQADSLLSELLVEFLSKKGFLALLPMTTRWGVYLTWRCPELTPRRFWFRTKVSHGLCISEPLLSSLSKWFFCKRTLIFTRRSPEGKYWIKEHEFPSSGRSQKAWVNARKIPVQGGLLFFPKEPVKLHTSLLTMLLIQQMNSVFLIFVQCSLGLQGDSHPLSPLTCSPSWSWWG